MTTIVSVVGLRGGAGRTTISRLLAHYAARRLNLRVLVVDHDPHDAMSTSIWNNLWSERCSEGSDRRKNISVVRAGAGELTVAANRNFRLSELLCTLSGEYDLIVIDTDASLSQATKACLVSQYVIIPVMAGSGAVNGLELLATAFRGLPAEVGLVITNPVPPEYREQDEWALEIKKFSKNSGWPVFNKPLRYSEPYAAAPRSGAPVGAERLARGQFDELATECLAHIGLTPNPLDGLVT